MPEDRLITVAIHTFEKATVLKSLLESEGIAVALQNVNLVQPVVSSGVRVRIHEADLPKALRIIESSEGLECKDEGAATPRKDDDAKDDAPAAAVHPVMVPVDFSRHSDAAVTIAFRYAHIVGAEVVIMHSFISPSIASNFQLTDNIDFDFETVDDDEVRLSIEDAARQQLDAYCTKVRQRIASGQIPPVRFSTQLIDDVPEDAINALARDISPRIIVMGTRGAGVKERDMIGSVTAEVLDTCRSAVLTVPDGVADYTPGERRLHLVFFCNYEQTDLLALDMLYRLFPEAAFDVTLLKVPSKKLPIDNPELSQGLLDYCRRNLPRFEFEIKQLSINDVEAEFMAIEQQRHIDIIAVPNKKRNIFSRLFNPGLAHRLLFHSDIPMVVLPI